MMPLLAFLLCFAGLTALALAKDKHHRDLFGALPKARRRRALTGGGWALLAISVLPLLSARGPAIGAIFWLGLATACALIVAMSLTYRPRLLPMAGLIVLPLSLCVAAIAGVS